MSNRVPVAQNKRRYCWEREEKNNLFSGNAEISLNLFHWKCSMITSLNVQCFINFKLSIYSIRLFNQLRIWMRVGYFACGNFEAEVWDLPEPWTLIEYFQGAFLNHWAIVKNGWDSLQVIGSHQPKLRCLHDLLSFLSLHLMKLNTFSPFPNIMPWHLHHLFSYKMCQNQKIPCQISVKLSALKNNVKFEAKRVLERHKHVVVLENSVLAPGINTLDSHRLAVITTGRGAIFAYNIFFSRVCFSLCICAVFFFFFKSPWATFYTNNVFSEQIQYRAQFSFILLHFNVKIAPAIMVRFHSTIKKNKNL